MDGLNKSCGWFGRGVELGSGGLRVWVWIKVGLGLGFGLGYVGFRFWPILLYYPANNTIDYQYIK